MSKKKQVISDADEKLKQLIFKDIHDLFTYMQLIFLSMTGIPHFIFIVQLIICLTSTKLNYTIILVMAGFLVQRREE